MKQKGYELIRLVSNQRRVGKSLQEVSQHWRGKKEHFLFISPHDDDAALGSGLLMQLAIKEGVKVHVIVVTNGSMGYCTLKEKDTISEIRKEETIKCYTMLGVPRENIIWLNFPDCNLSAYQGRRPMAPHHVSETAIAGFTGLQNAFTYHLRKLNPTQCFVPTFNDLHPDHKYTYQEFMISVFHAGGEIWPELGKPMKEIPYISEMAVYCDFPTKPQLRLMAPERVFEKKLKSILVFKSQRQIKSLVKSVRMHGPVEYFKNIYFNLYNPQKYNYRFTEENHEFNARYS